MLNWQDYLAYPFIVITKLKTISCDITLMTPPKVLPCKRAMDRPPKLSAGSTGRIFPYIGRIFQYEVYPCKNLDPRIFINPPAPTIMQS